MEINQENFDAAWLCYDDTGVSSTVPPGAQAECERICSVALAKLNINLVPHQAECIWSSYSRTFAAKWMYIEGDHEIVDSITRFIRNHLTDATDMIPTPPQTTADYLNAADLNNLAVICNDAQNLLTPQGIALLLIAARTLVKANTPFEDNDSSVRILHENGMFGYEINGQAGGVGLTFPFTTWREAYRAAEGAWGVINLQKECDAVAAKLASLEAKHTTLVDLMNQYRDVTRNISRESVKAWEASLWTRHFSPWEPPESIVHQLCSLWCAHTVDMIDTHVALSKERAENAQLKARNSAQEAELIALKAEQSLERKKFADYVLKHDKFRRKTKANKRRRKI